MKNVRFLFVFVAVIAVLLTACGGLLPLLNRPLLWSNRLQPNQQPLRPLRHRLNPQHPLSPPNRNMPPSVKQLLQPGVKRRPFKCWTTNIVSKEFPMQSCLFRLVQPMKSQDPDMECVDQMQQRR